MYGITSAASKGNQIKWRKDDTWVKCDMQGYEGLAEEFASKLLDCTDIPHVRYHSCLIASGNSHLNGCYCKSIYRDGESFYSLTKLYEAFGLILHKQHKTQPSIDIIKGVIEFLSNAYNVDVTNYLINMLYFDKLTANEDRHLNNTGLIKDIKGQYRPAPIFDNGLSFLSRDEFWGDCDMVYALNHVKFLPFGNKQTRALRKAYPNNKLLLYKDKVKRLLCEYRNDYYNDYYVERCKSILKWQLKTGGGLYWELI